jgi:hypothetical protein
VTRDNFTYYIHESMLDEHATEEDARRMVDLLYHLGYEVRYGDVPNQPESHIADKDWKDALDTVQRERSGSHTNPLFGDS